MAADRRFPGWVRYSGVGLELAAVVAGFALVGSWLDGRFDSAPWGVVVGVVLGLVGGLYNLVRESLRAMREAGPFVGDSKPPDPRESDRRARE